MAWIYLRRCYPPPLPCCRKRRKQVADVCVFCRFAAGDDWPLPRRVLHHIQACLARSRRYRRHQILAVRPAQVIAAPRQKNNTEKRAGRLREGKRLVREHFRSDGVAVLGSEPHAGGGVPACEWRMSPTARCFAKLFSPQALHTLSQKQTRHFAKRKRRKSTGAFQRIQRCRYIPHQDIPPPRNTQERLVSSRATPALAGAA